MMNTVSLFKNILLNNDVLKNKWHVQFVYFLIKTTHYFIQMLQL